MKPSSDQPSSMLRAPGPHIQTPTSRRSRGYNVLPLVFVVGDYQRRSRVTAMLTSLKWDSLEIRRRLRDAAMFFKIFNGHVNIPLPPAIVAADNRTRCLHEHKLRVIPSTCLLYQNSYYVRCIPIWNNLPHQAVCAATVKAFQSAALPAIRTM